MNKKFWASIGIGALATLAIPTLAAPHVAKLMDRHLPAKTAKASKPVAKKAAAHPAPKKPQTAKGTAKQAQPGAKELTKSTAPRKVAAKAKPSASAKKLLH